MTEERRAGMAGFRSAIRETFGFSPMTAVSFAFAALATLFAVYWFLHSAPPGSITITSGPPGSIFLEHAEKFKKILAKNGITLRIITSEGSVQNLKRLADPSFKADIGFVQGGEAGGLDTGRLVSLGTLYYAPVLIFYRNYKPVQVLSRFKGKRISIGPEGSGTRILALALFAANGIKPGGTTRFLSLEGGKAVQALINGDVDAVFLMGESASVQNMKRLVYAPGIRMFSFGQADAYSRRMVYLDKMVLPEGSADLGKNIPRHDMQLIGPSVELVARKGLNPALTDLLIEAAQETYGNATPLHRQGEFPSPQRHEFPMSAEALRYYKSGKTFLYRSLPFRFAGLANRVLLVFVPLVLLLVPGFKVIPMLYRWKFMFRLYRWYRSLMIIEHELLAPLTAGQKEELLKRLDILDKAVTRTKVLAPFAGQFYALRADIGFVRNHLMGGLMGGPMGGTGQSQ